MNVEGMLDALPNRDNPAIAALVNRTGLVIAPEIESKQVQGTARHPTNAISSGRIGDVVDVLESNF